MATRSVENWKAIIKQEGDFMHLAKFLIGDLAGYPIKSKHISDDEQSVFNLILALRSE